MAKQNINKVIHLQVYWCQQNCCLRFQHMMNLNKVITWGRPEGIEWPLLVSSVNLLCHVRIEGLFAAWWAKGREKKPLLYLAIGFHHWCELINGILWTMVCHGVLIQLFMHHTITCQLLKLYKVSVSCFLFVTLGCWTKGGNWLDSPVTASGLYVHWLSAVSCL